MKKYKKFLGYIFVLLAVLILVNLPNMIYPKVYEGGIDTTQYLIEVILNIVRYMALSIISFILGIKILFKN